MKKTFNIFIMMLISSIGTQLYSEELYAMDEI
jgi:hypothetical protein